MPFVAKVIGLPVAKIAAARDGRRELASFELKPPMHRHTSRVKEAVFPFARFPGVDTVLGPEMKSTGEVMGLDAHVRDRLRQEPDRRRYQPAALGYGVRVGARRRQGTHPAVDPIIGVARLQDASRRRARNATWRNTASQATKINKVLEGRPHIVDAIKNSGVQLVFNTTDGRRPWPTAARFVMPPSCIKCRTTPLFQVPSRRRKGSRPTSAGDLEVRALQSYFNGKP